MRQLEWLSPSDIKDKVCALLQRYNQKFDDRIEGEVPVEKIAELILDLKFDLDKPTNLNLPANTFRRALSFYCSPRNRSLVATPSCFTRK